MPVNKRVDERVQVSAVRDAYLRGDFERCLDLCDAFHRHERNETVEIELLRARALIPLNRADRALDVLRRLRIVDRSGDESLVARMLTGAAYLSLGQTDRALEALRSAHASAERAHPT